jgi:transcriptional regulator with XRE-family HTH domain
VQHMPRSFAISANADSSESVDDRVRRRLRELRTERGLTLKAVAERASLDLSTLSRLESGKRRLALDHLPALATALDVSVDDLVASPRRQDPRVRSRARTMHGMTLWPLTHQGPARGVHAYKVRIHADRDRPPDELPVHEGQDWMYVLSGRMRLMLGEDDLIIEPGEVVEFNTWTPHWFGAAGGPVELILLVGYQGERVHLHGELT